MMLQIRDNLGQPLDIKQCIFLIHDLAELHDADWHVTLHFTDGSTEAQRLQAVGLDPCPIAEHVFDVTPAEEHRLQMIYALLRQGGVCFVDLDHANTAAVIWLRPAKG